MVCAESCRGIARTRRVEAAPARHDQARGQRPPVSVVVTDIERLAQAVPSARVLTRRAW
ncbi:MAG: hypothetical protein ACRDRI_18935 [Pseudonocardiaceae bacterium]